MPSDTPVGVIRALLVDWGGVMTSSVFASFAGFCEREGLPANAVRDRFRTDPAARDLLVGLECGTLPEDEFEDGFAALLGVPGRGLIDRLMADLRIDEVMVALVRRARRHAIVTGLISNSWGSGRYDRELIAELFDGVVISADVGIRKPDPEIYALGAAAVGQEPAACVFIDDLPGNLKPARAMGMTTVHHTAAPLTVTALTGILGWQSVRSPDRNSA